MSYTDCIDLLEERLNAFEEYGDSDQASTVVAVLELSKITETAYGELPQDDSEVPNETSLVFAKLTLLQARATLLLHGHNEATPLFEKARYQYRRLLRAVNDFTNTETYAAVLRSLDTFLLVNDAESYIKEIAFQHATSESKNAAGNTEGAIDICVKNCWRIRAVLRFAHLLPASLIHCLTAADDKFRAAAMRFGYDPNAKGAPLFPNLTLTYNTENPYADHDADSTHRQDAAGNGNEEART